MTKPLTDVPVQDIARDDAAYSRELPHPQQRLEIPTLASDRARLGELYHEIDQLLNAGNLHSARRLTVHARNLSRRIYGDAPIMLRAHGGR